MLLSSMAPLFLLIGLKGLNNVISDEILWKVVAVLIVLPLIVIGIRIGIAKERQDTFKINVEHVQSNKEYLFTFFFVVLLPIYGIQIETPREFYTMIFAICVMIFILWNVNLHFTNIFFALLGYRVYTVEIDKTYIILSQRHFFPKAVTSISCFRISDTVLIEIIK